MLNRFRFLFACVAALSVWACTSPAPPAAKSAILPERPNILFVVFEDMSPRIRAYGDSVATTPVLDAFAAESVRYTRVFTTAGVCAPSRSALITGVHQQTLGTQYMRTRSEVPGIPPGGPINYDAVPPASVKAFPELLRGAGYYTTNNGKTDYQFGEPFTIWDEQSTNYPWGGRAEGQPFFAMVNIMTTHESYLWPTDKPSDNPLIEYVRQRNLRDLAGKMQVTDTANVEVPPYLPDTPSVRADIARQYDNIHFSEAQLAGLLDQLEADGLADSTIVIVTTDHGDGLPRMKRSIYDSGILVPMMVRYPDGWGAGSVNEELVSFVDLAPTFLSLAGVNPPDYIQGRVLFGAGRQAEPEYIYAAMDRHDEVPDRLRAVRDRRWKYIRNYQPDHPFFRHLAFRDVLPSMQAIWQAKADGTMPPELAQYFESSRPEEELYDTETDPDEVVNLAANADNQETLLRLRAAHEAFMSRAGDLSEISESEMVAQMWPGFEQPVTATPEIMVEGKTVTASSATEGSSIGYRNVDGEGPWHVYNGPFEAVPGTELIFKAQRYGYAESAIVTVSVP